MSRKHHTMLDIETLATSDKAVVVSVGAVTMRYDTLEIVDEYECIFEDLEEQVKLGREKSEQTLEWWSKLPPGASDPLYNNHLFPEILRTTRRGLIELSAFCKNTYVWGLGSMFDNVIIRSIMKDFEVKPLWHYRDDMCFRTIMNLFPVAKDTRIGTHHNALDDARSQMALFKEIILKHNIPLKHLN